MGNINNLCVGAEDTRVLDLENLLLQFEREHDALNHDLDEQQLENKQLRQQLESLQNAFKDEKELTMQLQMKVQTLTFKFKRAETENEELLLTQELKRLNDESQKLVSQMSNAPAQQLQHYITSNSNAHLSNTNTGHSKSRTATESEPVPMSAYASSHLVYLASEMSDMSTAEDHIMGSDADADDDDDDDGNDGDGDDDDGLESDEYDSENVSIVYDEDDDDGGADADADADVDTAPKIGSGHSKTPVGKLKIEATTTTSLQSTGSMNTPMGVHRYGFVSSVVSGDSEDDSQSESLSEEIGGNTNTNTNTDTDKNSDRDHGDEAEVDIFEKLVVYQNECREQLTVLSTQLSTVAENESEEQTMQALALPDAHKIHSWLFDPAVRANRHQIQVFVAELLTNRSLAHRQHISVCYAQTYPDSKGLEHAIHDLYGNNSKNIESNQLLLLNAISGLLMTSSEYDSLFILQTINIGRILDFVCTRSVRQVQIVFKSIIASETETESESDSEQALSEASLVKQIVSVAEAKNEKMLARILETYFKHRLKSHNQRNSDENNTNNDSNDDIDGDMDAHALQNDFKYLSHLHFHINGGHSISNKATEHNTERTNLSSFLFSDSDEIRFALTFVESTAAHLRALETRWQSEYGISLAQLIAQYFLWMNDDDYFDNDHGGNNTNGMHRQYTHEQRQPSLIETLCLNCLQFANNASVYYCKKLVELGSVFGDKQQSGTEAEIESVSVSVATPQAIIASIFINRFEKDLKDIQIEFHAGKYDTHGGRTLAEWIEWKSSASAFGFFLVQMLSNCK